MVTATGALGENQALTYPAVGLIEVTPNDSVDLVREIRAIIVGTVGDVNVIASDGTTGVLPNLAAGIAHVIRCTRIKATDTTATRIVGIY